MLFERGVNTKEQLNPSEIEPNVNEPDGIVIDQEKSESPLSIEDPENPVWEPKSFLRRVNLYTLDRSLRSSSKLPAKGVRFFFGSLTDIKGPKYLKGPLKRVFDLAIASPLAVLATPAIFSFGIIQKIADPSGPMFYKHEVVGPGNSKYYTYKIRTMLQGSEPTEETAKHASYIKPEDDNRIFGIGRFLRRFELDELPQLWQVVKGTLSLFGFRPVHEVYLEYGSKNWSPEHRNKWKFGYNEYKHGLSGGNQAINPNKKDGSSKFHPEMFYIRNASIGFDLYLIWRTVLNILRIRVKKNSK